MDNLYHNDPYLREVATKIITSFDEDGENYVKVEKNIFYPHGGGQKGDRGFLQIDGQEFLILDTKKDPYSDFDVLLIVKDPVPEDIHGKDVLCKLDWEFRYKQMRLHSSVHFHHCMLERVTGKQLVPPKNSDIQDGYAFNRYEKISEITAESIERASEEFMKIVELGADIITYPDSERPGYRWWECLNFKIPCGGTHIRNMKEVGSVEIKHSSKKGQPTVNITLI